MCVLTFVCWQVFSPTLGVAIFCRGSGGNWDCFWPWRASVSKDVMSRELELPLTLWSLRWYVSSKGNICVLVLILRFTVPLRQILQHHMKCLSHQIRKTRIFLDTLLSAHYLKYPTVLQCIAGRGRLLSHWLLQGQPVFLSLVVRGQNSQWVPLLFI